MAYLQKSWGDSIQNPTPSDVQTAITEMRDQEAENDGFWIGTDDDEMVLEMQKDFTLTLVLCGEICRTATCLNSQQAVELYRRFLKGEYEMVKDEFECLT